MSNRIERRSHQPKGGQCCNCIHSQRDCSGLPFEQMPVIKTASDGVKVVSCAEYSRESNKGRQ